MGMDVLKSYNSSEKDRVYYTLEVLGKDDIPSTLAFYKVEVTKDGYPQRQSILDLKITSKKNKKTLDLVQDLVKSFKINKENKRDK